MSNPTVSPHQDRISFVDGGPTWPVVEIDLETHLRNRSIEIRREQVDRASSGRACRAAWLLEGGRLWFNGVWGRIANFRFPSGHPRERWVGEFVDAEEKRWLRSQGATRLRQRFFPGSNPITPIPADWVDQELMVLEGSPFPGSSGRHWGEYPKHRMITVQGGRVVRAWVRRNDPPEATDPTANDPNIPRDQEEN